jgi:predicted small secreted protein
MNMTRKLPAALVAAIALAGAGCNSDDAAKKDVKNAAEDVQKAGEKAGKDVENAAKDVSKAGEKAAPGDADNDGK